MLCPKCDAIRFPQAQSNGDSELSCRGSTANAGTNATSKAKQMNSANANANGKSGVTSIDDPAPCDNSQGQGNAVNTATVDTVIDDQISLLRAEVTCQRDLILKLQQQLRSVLSFLGIPEQDIQLPVGNESGQINNMPTCQVGVAGQPSWAEVAANIQRVNSPERQKPLQPVTTLQQKLIAAVYVDQSEQKRRESSLIVFGLQESETQTDKLIFTNLCNEEFNVQPDIVITKRLGRAQSTKIRPLLIATRKTDQAQHLIAAAKQLRKSSNPTVRDNVYINRNLTKAEAEAAYYVRVQRRQAAVHRADNRGKRYETSNLGNEQSDIDVSRSLLNIAQNPNVFVPPPPTSDSRTSVNGDPVLPAIIVPPAADQSRQHGRHD
jgi:hypothetical protein